jgi:hypothetical protein
MKNKIVAREILKIAKELVSGGGFNGLIRELDKIGIEYEKSKQYNSPVIFVDYKSAKNIDADKLDKKYDLYHSRSLRGVMFYELSELDKLDKKRKKTKYKDIEIKAPIEIEVDPKSMSYSTFAISPNAWYVPVLKGEFNSLKDAKKAIDNLYDMYKEQQQYDDFEDWGFIDFVENYEEDSGWGL